MNPVLWLELRIRSSEKRLWILALFGMGVMAVVCGLVLASFFMSRSNSFDTDSAQVGTAITWSCLACHAAIMILLAPLAGAGRISSEREQRTLPALLNTPMRPASLLWGKLAGCWLFILWLGFSALPFLAIGILWGGPPPAVVLGGFTFNLLAGLTLGTLALGLSGWFGRSLTAYLCTGAALIAWIVVIPLLGVLLQVLGESLKWEIGAALPYTSLYHLPFAPLLHLSSADWSVWETAPISLLVPLAYPLAIWATIALTGIWMALRGLKREVF